MPLDALCLEALTAELKPALTGAHIDKIRQPEKDIIILHLRGGSGAKKLLISAGTTDARLHFTDAEIENPSEPPMFCMLLRKHLTGAVIKEVTQPERERVVIFDISVQTAPGEYELKRLALELMNRTSNVILVGGDGRIIDCLRRVDTGMSESRPVLPGLIYHLPPRQHKRDPMELTADDWRVIAVAPPYETALEKRIIASVTAISPLIAREIVFRAYKSTDTSAGEASDRDGGAAFAKAAIALLGDARVPSLLTDADGNAKDFSFTAPCQYENAMVITHPDSFSELLDGFYTKRSRIARLKTRSANMERTVKNARDRAVRRDAAQRSEVESAGERNFLRENGDLIIANLHNIRQGQDSAEVEDYYNGGTRKIRLDARLTPQQNAQKHYKEYAKARNAEKFLTDQIVRGENEIQYLESVLTELRLAESESEIEEIRRELEEMGYIRESKKRSKIKASKPRQYTAPSGAAVLVGRGNKQNDELTFKKAFKTDIWLHAQKRHGAHVLLRTGNGFTDADVEFAAAIAAYYSDAREERRAAVDWCYARYVKKMPGGQPGMVLYTDYSTVIVEPKDAETVSTGSTRGKRA